VEHRIVIQNRGREPVLLPVQESLEMDVRLEPNHHIEQWWVDKGASTPTPDGTHHRALSPGDESVLHCFPSARDKPRDPIPWTSVQDVDGCRGWYAGVEFTARVELAIRADPQKLHVEIGLQNDPNRRFVTRLMPGETFEAPPVFVGCYEGDVDDGANRLRRWVRANVAPKARDPRYPLLVNNSWGSGMAVDEALARRMIDESAELGLEMFHIDAGWFRTVGDWRPNPNKFANGLAPVADYAHRKGLKFGLWVGWTQGGDQVDSSGRHQIMSVFDPFMTQWFSHDVPASWKAKDFSGQTVCLGESQAVEWCLNALRPIIKDAKLDLLEHDQVMVIDDCGRDTHRHTRSPADVGYRAAQGYYKVYDTLRTENPDLLFENCVNGGHMVDYGAVRRCHYISITDTYDPLSNRRAFYDASYALPPAMCECYIAQVPTPDLSRFLYMLRSGMMGWCTIMMDTSKWSPGQHEAAKKQFALYKARLRPLIQSADLYHVSERPDGVRWDGIEYWDPRAGRGAVFAFRGITDEAAHDFRLKGLEPAATYALSFEDGTSENPVRTGAALMSAGIRVNLPVSQSSEIVHIERQ
jgi:alpha-galactosidase